MNGLNTGTVTTEEMKEMVTEQVGPIELPEVTLNGNISIEEAIRKRRSHRDLSENALPLDVISQLLWSASGVTELESDRRAAPSAGDTYPIEIYLVAAHVDEIKTGVYHYMPKGHSLIHQASGDKRTKLYQQSPDHEVLQNAPATLVITGNIMKTARKYGDLAERYVHIEAGAISENIQLQAQALDIGTFIVGSFYSESVRDALNIPEDEVPLILLPLGKHI